MAALVLIFVAGVVPHARALRKRGVTEQRRKQLERIVSDFRTAIYTWRGKHDIKAARSVLERLVHKHEMDAAVFDLAVLYTEQRNYKQALECYRDIFTRPHGWHSTQETDPSALGAYVDVARKVGAPSDAELGDKLILRYYRPLGDNPPLIVDYSQPAAIHAYACAARALMGHAVAMAEEAVRTLPNDGMLRWIAGTVLFDARRLPEAKRQFLLAEKIGGLSGAETRIIDQHLLQLNATAPANGEWPKASRG
jgi:hypothetical protein